jgi:hypothetical protein
MSAFSFPSPEFPAFPEISITVPDGWSAGPPAPALLTALAPHHEDRFRANVVVTAERLSAPIDFPAYSSGVRQRVAELDSVQIAFDKLVQFSGRTAHIIQFTYRHPDVGTLAQAILTVPFERGQTLDMFEVVGSAGANRIDTDFAQVDEIMRSFTASAPAEGQSHP